MWLLGVFSKPLASVESDRLVNRLNDAKCDRRGRLWCGTMAAVPESGPTSSEYPKNNGNFYSFDGGKLISSHIILIVHIFIHPSRCCYQARVWNLHIKRNRVESGLDQDVLYRLSC